MPLDIRLLKNSEYKTVNEFYNSTAHIGRPAPAKARDFNEFRWEFIDRPEGEAIYAGAFDTDGPHPVLVGTQCVILSTMITAAGKRFLAAKGEATLISLDALMKFRNTDILKELFEILIAECKSRGVEFLWGFNTIPASYKRLGFQTPFKSRHATLILKPLSAYRHLVSSKQSKLRDHLRVAAGSALSVLFSFKRALLPSSGRQYQLLSALDENASLFQNASSIPGLAFLMQDRNFLKWKISDNPYPIRYFSRQLIDRTGRMVAQVIFSTRGNTAFIEQTLFDKELNNTAIFFLFRNIFRALKKMNVSLVRFTGFNNNVINAKEMVLLKKLGFLFSPHGEWFTFKPVAEHCAVKPADIYLSRMYKQGVN
jgi:hypothetical protein